MRAFGPADLLELWEAGTAQPRWDWARAVLRSGWPELERAGANGVDALTVGERDARLLELREALFGPELACRSTCPACGTAVETELTVADLRAPAVVARASRPCPEIHTASADEDPVHAAERRQAALRDEPHCGYPDPPRPDRLVRDDLEISVRAPNLRDLAETAHPGDPATMRAELLARCVCVTRAPGERLAAGELPASTLDDVLQQLAAADPGADLRLALACPACGHRWLESFDIVAYLWTELDGWAQRTLHEVHLLAAVYGWSEAEVLALSPRRRAHYLELVNA